MTTFDRDPLFDPRISDWFEDDPDHAPEVILETVAAAFPSIPQRHASRVPWRFPSMSMPTRVAAIVAVGALIIAGALAMTGTGSRSSPSQITHPTAVPSVAPASPSGSLLSTPAPTATWGDWEAEFASAVAPYASAGERIQLSIDWQAGIGTWIQTSSLDQVMHADSVAAPPGEIDLVSTEGQAGGCTIGDKGRYRWSRSADGLFLTLTKVEDACAARAAVLDRTWVHPLDAVNDGGPGVIPFAGRWLQLTLPSRRFAMGGSVESPDIHLFDDQAASVRLVVIKDPLGFAKPCSTTDHSTISIPRTTAGFVSYIRTLPGLTASTSNATVDGRSAVHVSVRPNGKPQCGVMGAFHSMDASVVPPEGEWDLVPADLHSFWIVGVDADTYLLWYEGGGVRAGDEQAVISSAKFLDKLPTP